MALHEALYGGLPRGHHRQADSDAGARGHGIIGISAGAVAYGVAARPEFLHAELRHRSAEKTIHQQSGADRWRVYDNLGLETAWKRYDTILVSDGGAKMEAEEEPKTDALRHTYRVLSLIDNQVRSLRKRQLIDSYKAAPQQAVHRKGAYWGIRTDIAHYQLPATLPCPFERTLELSRIGTRLKRLDDPTQERLINWGYAVCDAALRKHVITALSMPQAFPYPASGV